MKELELRSGIRFDLDSDGLTLCRFGQRVLCGGPSVSGGIPGETDARWILGGILDMLLRRVLRLFE